jgi:hypothetical protein
MRRYKRKRKSSKWISISLLLLTSVALVVTIYIVCFGPARADGQSATMNGGSVEIVFPEEDQYPVLREARESYKLVTETRDGEVVTETVMNRNGRSFFDLEMSCGRQVLLRELYRERTMTARVVAEYKARCYEASFATDMNRSVRGFRVRVAPR